MVDISALTGLFGGLNTSLNVLKTAVDIRDSAKIVAAVSDIQAKLLTTQNSVFAAQGEKAALVDEVAKLKKEIADFENWEAEKQRYELKKVGYNDTFIYSLKIPAQVPEPEHSICPDCYQQRKKSLLQSISRSPGRNEVLICQQCGWESYISGEWRPEHGGARSASRRRS